MAKRLKRPIWLTAVAILCAASLGLAVIGWQTKQVRADPSTTNREASQPAEVEFSQPAWKVGDSWKIVTLTEKLQGREELAAGNRPKIPWRFCVVGIEPVAGQQCYRVDVECLAQGRVRPKTTVWYDQKTLFLRQFQTQIAVGGRYQVLQESYEPGPDGHAPVLTPINALPVTLPAFPPEGAKQAQLSFRYTSQPAPAGSKDISLIRFSHRTTQQVTRPSAKSVERIKRAYSKALDAPPVAEVTLKDYGHTVVQHWQKGAPWPLYVDNGRTQAWLVDDNQAAPNP